MAKLRVQIAPYGSWKSPITSALIAEGSISLPEVRLDGDDVYWLELRPKEPNVEPPAERYVIVRAKRRAAGRHRAAVQRAHPRA